MVMKCQYNVCRHYILVVIIETKGGCGKEFGRVIEQYFILQEKTSFTITVIFFVH